jgi:DNA-directed RNA polymerase sigma subunit (sigma70/sigma32)
MSDEAEQLVNGPAENVFGSFPYRTKQILLLRLGLRGRKYSLNEVGEIFGITPERVRQVEKRAWAKLCDSIVSAFKAEQ